MKITREINGQTVEIELTEEETWRAYNERRLEFAYEDLEIWLRDRYDDEEEPRPEMNEQDKADIVERYLEDKDCEWFNWMKSAVEAVVL